MAAWALLANVSPAFTPVRSELGNATGFSRGFLNLVVLPSGEPFPASPAWWLFAAVLGFVLLGLQRARYGGRFPRAAVAAEAVAFLLLAAAVASPYVSASRVVFAPRTFVLLWLLLSLTSVLALGHRAREQWAGRPWARPGGIVAAGVLAAGFFASMMLQALHANGGSYSAFLHVADKFAAAPFLHERPDLASSLMTSLEGYDGQFMYLMAFDPFIQRFRDDARVYRQVVDDPPYRYGRIGFSALTRALSGRAPERYPATMAWLTVLAHVPLATALALVAATGGRSPFASLAYLAIPGFAVSVLFGLPESLAAAGLALGMVAWQRNRAAYAVACFAASMLIRETGALLVMALAAWALVESRARAWWLLLSFVPMACWRLFVATRFFADFGWHAVFPSPGDFGVPFAGLAQLMRAGVTGTQSSPEVASAIMFPMLLAAALALAVSAFVVRRSGIAAAAVGYAIVAVSLNYDKIWAHLPSGERGTFELFLLLAVLWLGGALPRWLTRTLAGFFVVLAGYTLFVSPEASMSRAALLLVR